MAFMHYDHKIKHVNIVNMYISHVHLSITVCTIANLPKIYQNVTDISDELIQNLYIQSQK